MSRFRKMTLALAAASLALAACGEKAQTATPAHKKADKPAYEGAPGDPFVAKGWTQGDKASWTSQIRERNQKQNEYNRAP